MARTAKFVFPLHLGSESVPVRSGGLAVAMTLTDSEQSVLARSHLRPSTPRIANGSCANHTRKSGPNVFTELSAAANECAFENDGQTRR